MRSAWRQRVPLAGTLALFALLAVVIILRKSVGEDESFTLYTTSGSLARTFRLALEFELQPPVYFLAANLWRRLGGSIEWLRLLSLASVLGTIVVLARLGTVLGLARRWFLPLLAALTPALLWAATEARVYGLTTLWVSLATLSFARLWMTDSPTPGRDLSLFALWSWLAILTQYYAGFALVGQAAAAFTTRRWGRMLAACAVVGLLLLPWAATVLHQVEAHPTYLEPAGISSQTWYGTVLGYGHRSARIMLAAVFDPALDLGRRPVLYGLEAVAAVLLALGLVSELRSRRDLPWWIAAWLPVLILLVLTLTQAVLVERRHWIATVPGMVVWLALLADRASRRAGSAALVAVGLPFMGATALMAGDYRGPLDWRAAAAFVRAHEGPGDVTILYLFGTRPFSHHYHGLGGTQPVERVKQAREARGREDARLSAAGDQTVQALGSQAERGGGGIWIVTGTRVDPAPIARGFSRVLDRPLSPGVQGQFRGLVVTRYRIE